MATLAAMLALNHSVTSNISTHLSYKENLFRVPLNNELDSYLEIRSDDTYLHNSKAEVIIDECSSSLKSFIYLLNL